MRRLCLAILCLISAGFPARGQEETAVVSVKVIPSVEAFRPGGTYPIALEISIRPPYHINAEQPLESFLIGTTVDFKPGTGVAYGKIVFPPAETRKLELSENPMAIYEGKFTVASEIKLAPDFQGNEVVIEGALGYQACDNQSCLPPTEAAFSLKVPVLGGTEAVKKEGGKGFASGAPPQKEAAKPSAGAATTGIPSKEQLPEAQKPVESFGTGKETGGGAGGISGGVVKGVSPLEGKGLPLTFVLVFLGGLALNLTPCIYPLIPITISYFGGQSQGKKGGIIAHSLLYVVGMAVTYSILGVIAAFTGSLFGAALQYPPVLIAIALVMVILALSMFNVYELRMPAFLNRIAGGSQKGFFGTFFMGLTVGIVAAPCIGPFVLGLLTYVGNKGNVFLGFTLFFVLALGLGLPFLFLGIFSGSISRLPRSGAWMVWVRTIFGFILIAMAFYFLRTLFPNPLYYHFSLALTMLVAGVYMAWIEPTKTPGKIFLYVRNIFGVVFFAIALFAAVTGVQAYLDEEVASRVQGFSSEAGSRASMNAIAWQPYSDENLAEAAREGKPVFIDFYADWCIPCKELDKKTFSDPEVVAASRDFFMLKADLTSAADERTRALYKKFQIKGVPTLVFIAGDGKEVPELRGTGFEPKKDFLPKMKRVLEVGGKENSD
jgi:thiol:disulfide interchange protein DsbD